MIPQVSNNCHTSVQIEAYRVTFVIHYFPNHCRGMFANFKRSGHGEVRIGSPGMAGPTGPSYPAQVYSLFKHINYLRYLCSIYNLYTWYLSIIKVPLIITYVSDTQGSYCILTILHLALIFTLYPEVRQLL